MEKSIEIYYAGRGKYGLVVSEIDDALSPDAQREHHLYLDSLGNLLDRYHSIAIREILIDPTSSISMGFGDEELTINCDGKSLVIVPLEDYQKDEVLRGIEALLSIN